MKKRIECALFLQLQKESCFNEELLLNSLVANFHTALDVKYAISDEILWSVFTHPLKELTQHQIEDAISQVYSANVTFGNTFTSTNLTFPGNTKKKEFPKKPANELPRPKGTRYQAEENLIFSLMKTIGFQTFLLTTDASVGEFFRLN